MEIEKMQNAKTKYIGKDLHFFKEIDSTQTEAKRNVEKYKDGSIIIADVQTSGKGTHGRIWHTKEDNIAMTIILKPKINLSKLEGFTYAIAENIKKAIRDLYNMDLEIKMPNDLLLNNKKICGILTETTTIKEHVKEIFSDYETKNCIKDAEIEAMSLLKKKNILGIVLKSDKKVLSLECLKLKKIKRS